MILDNTLVFSSAQSLVTNGTTGSTYVIDLAVGGSTSAATYSTTPNLSWGPNATTFGEDLGIGAGVAELMVGVYAGTAFAIGSSTPLLQVQFQGAADNGAGTVASITWTTYTETDALATAVLTANTPVAKLWWPHRAVGAALPRFVRLNYLVSGGSFSAGTVSSYVMSARDDWSTGQYPSGFSVAS